MAASRANVAYFRYVDDAFLLTSEAPGPLFEELQGTLERDFGLSVHPVDTTGSKSTFGLVTNESAFPGYLFRGGKARVKEQSVQRLERSLADIFTRYKYRCEEIRRKHPSKAERRKLLGFVKNSLLWESIRVLPVAFSRRPARAGASISRRLTSPAWNSYASSIIRLQTCCAVSGSGHGRRCALSCAFILNAVARIRRPREHTEFRYGVSRGNAPHTGALLWLQRPRMSDAAVKANFAYRIQRATKELELDIQDIS